MAPPLIVADNVTVLGISTRLVGETWVLTTFNNQQPIRDYLLWVRTSIVIRILSAWKMRLRA
jgi:hypothetical protein